MEENFELDRPYSFEYERTVTDINGQSFLILRGGYRVRALDYQVVWGEIPHTIVCVVKGLNPLKLVQSKAAILIERYAQKNVKHTFRIVGYSYDENTDKFYYTLEDEFSLRHRYYPGDKRFEGETVDLWVLGVKKKSWTNAFLELSEEPPRESLQTMSVPALLMAEGPEVIVDERENDRIEFKSSLVFPAATSEPDIDTQTRIIMQSIAGMMNAEGGTVYIGLDNSGRLGTGIEGDFKYLNQSQLDKFNDYTETDDGYEVKLQNSVSLFLGTFAKTYETIHIERGKRKDNRYVRIDVSPSDWPVWVNGKDLFVRTGNTTTHMRGDNITKFVMKKMGVLTGTTIAERQQDAEEEDPFVEVTPASKKEQDNEYPSIPSIKPVPATIDLFEKERVWRYLYLLEGGGFSVVKPTAALPENATFKIALPVDTNEHLGCNLVICYDNGDTDWVNLNKALYRNGRVIPGGARGWNSDKTIVSAFCLRDNQKRHDLVAFVSEKDGITYVKCNTQQSLGKNPHKQLGNSGNKMLENGSELLYAMRISGEEDNRRVLESISLVFEDRINHTNGLPIDSLPDTARMLLEQVLKDVGLLDATEAKTQDENFDADPIAITDSNVQVSAPVATKDYNEIWVYSESGSFLKRLAGTEFDEVNALFKTYSRYSFVRDELFRRFPVLRKSGNLFIFRVMYEGKVSYERMRMILAAILSAQSDYLMTADKRRHVVLPELEISRLTGIENSAVSRAVKSFDLIAKSGRYDKKDLISSAGKDGHSQGEVSYYIERLLDEARRDGTRTTSEEISAELYKRWGIQVASRTVRKYWKELDTGGRIAHKPDPFVDSRPIIDGKDQSIVSVNIERIKDGLQRGNKERVLVIYPDGQYIYENSSVATMLEVIKRAGIDNVRSLGLIGREGRGKTPRVEFIGTVPYFDGKDGSGVTQEKVEGYYVFKKYSIDSIIAKIEQISKGLNLGLICELF